MTDDKKILQQIQILGGLVVLWLFFADGFILGKLPSDIKRLKRKIDTLATEKQNFENLQLDISALETELEDSRDSLEDLFRRFPSTQNAEILISQTIGRITQKMIVESEKTKAKTIKTYIAKNSEKVTVAKVADSDAPLEVDPEINIAFYEKQMTMKSNYFELLEFLHELANQDIFFTPLELKLVPNPEVPYGMVSNVRLLTFGFEGFKKVDKD